MKCLDAMASPGVEPLSGDFRLCPHLCPVWAGDWSDGPTNKNNSFCCLLSNSLFVFFSQIGFSGRQSSPAPLGWIEIYFLDGHFLPRQQPSHTNNCCHKTTQTHTKTQTQTHKKHKHGYFLPRHWQPLHTNGQTIVVTNPKGIWSVSGARYFLWIFPSEEWICC